MNANKLLTEISAANHPGMYQVTGGIDTTGFSGAYHIIALQTPGSTAKIPTPEEMRVGGRVDKVYEIDTNVDAAIVDIAAVDGKVDVVDGVVDGIATDLTAIGTDVTTVRKFTTNRQRLIEGSSANLLTYDDDSVTVIGTQDSTDKDGGPVDLSTGQPANRSKAV